MTLSHRFWFWSFVLTLLATFMGSVALLNLRDIYLSARASIAQYGAMDRADAVMVRVGWLGDALRGADGERYLDSQYYVPIRADLDALRDEVSRATTSIELSGGEADLAKAMSEHFDAAALRSKDVKIADKRQLAASVAGELDAVKSSLASIVRLAPDAARRQTSVTVAKVQSALWWTCFWLLVVIVISSVIHYRQWRALVRPLVTLRDDMRLSAVNDFRDRLSSEGAGEFRELATYFNGLLRDLAELYGTLEQKIVERSRALVRSERLASVGFLAAGVAHEINNPLSVISGYAELSAKRLRRALDGDIGDATGSEVSAEEEARTLSGVLETQEIIREEAFRCKEITNRLLSLARGGSDQRESLELGEVARQVIVLTRGLERYRERRIVLDFDGRPSLPVVANRTEMKQVLLNLTVNALEASAGSSEVRIGGRRDGAWIELYVQDQGKGMSPATLEQIFEPFYTDKRGIGEAGTGLGLSITHAIIENHGGTITASSRGVGTGSRFTIRLPAAVPESLAAGDAPALLS